MEMGEQKKNSSNSTQINELMVENKRIYKKKRNTKNESERMDMEKVM